MNSYDEVLNYKIDKMMANEKLDLEERKLILSEVQTLNDIVKESNRRVEEIARFENERSLNNKKFIKDICIEGSKILCFVGGTIVVLAIEKDGFVKTTLGKLFANKLPFGKL